MTLIQRVLTLTGLAGLIASAPVLAQQDFSTVQIIPHHVAGSVYYLEGAGGNIGLSIGEDGVVMIDDQYAPERPIAGGGLADTDLQ